MGGQTRGNVTERHPLASAGNPLTDTVMALVGREQPAKTPVKQAIPETSAAKCAADAVNQPKQGSFDAFAEAVRCILGLALSSEEKAAVIRRLLQSDG